MPAIRTITALALATGMAVVASATPARADQLPNGRIAYASYEDGDMDIYTMNPDGTDVQNLTTAYDEPFPSDCCDDMDPSWSPDGTKIAYTSTREHADGGSNVWVMDADGSNQVRLTDVSYYNFAPSWAPDGTKIVFTSGREDANGSFDWDIYTMNADGSEQTDITTPYQDIPYDDFNPDWSPDGSRIVFQGAREGAWEVLTVNPDGSGEANLTAEDDPPYANINGAPSYRPDGSKIVYHSQPNDGSNEWDIWVMNPDGTGKENVVPDEEWQDLLPAWSPEGNQILFQSNRSPLGEDIYVVDYPPPPPLEAPSSTATRVRRVTSNGTSTSPDWGPGPTSVTLMTNLSGEAEVPGPGDPNGTGVAKVRVLVEERTLCYKVRVARVALPATGAHIHRARAGKSGPIVVTLAPPGADGRSQGCVENLDPQLTADIAVNPKKYYLNVHTTEFPAGAVRGQLA